MANKIKTISNQTKKGKSGTTLIMDVFSLIILCVFPVVYHNYYFDILETKYQFFCGVAIGMFSAMGIYGLMRGRIKSYLGQNKISGLIKRLNIVDWAMICFWLSNVISWLLCDDWRWEAFWGTSGRYNGVFLITIYLAVYFMMTRFYVFQRWHLDAFFAVAIFVCLFGISDFFQLDLLGFKERMLEKQLPLYTSTIGNINTYTVYVGMVLAISMILFVLEKKTRRSIWYFCVMAIAMLALIIGTSDSAYLTIAALFGFAPLYLFRNKKGIRRYLTSLALLLTTILFVGWISVVFAERVFNISGLFTFLINTKILPLLAVLLWGIAGVWGLIEKKKVKTDTNDDSAGKIFVYLWMGVIAVVAAVVLYVLYDANIAGNVEKYQSIKRYVVFNNSWGSSRGYIWKCAIELYNNVFSLPQKVFGYGADTFRLIMIQHYPPYNNLVFDAAHNEYIHFLVTIGLAGMMSYIIFLVSSVVTMAKQMKKNPEIAAIMFSIVAFAIQATVNIFLPVVMPVVLQLLCMGLGMSRCKQKIEEN